MLGNGTRVRTNLNAGTSDGWTASAKLSRKHGVAGTVIDYHDSHGLCYDVRHDDGSMGHYDPWELELHQRLIIRAATPDNHIWLYGETSDNLLEMNRGVLKTSVLPGRYRVRFGEVTDPAREFNVTGDHEIAE